MTLHEYELRYPGGLRIGDTHVHTCETDGWIRPTQTVDLARKNKLDEIAITDHDNYGASVQAQQYAERNGFKDIIVHRGSEIYTPEGHVLAIGITSDIAPGQSVGDTIKRVHEQKGIAIAAHPGLQHADSLGFDTLERIMDSADPDAHFDGIEVYNANADHVRKIPFFGKRLFSVDSNKATETFYNAHKTHPHIGAAVGGSDAHLPGVVALGVTGFWGDNLIESIHNRQTTVFEAKDWHVNPAVNLVLQYIGAAVRMRFQKRFGRRG